MNGREYECAKQTTGWTGAKTLAMFTVPSGKLIYLMSSAISNPDEDTNEQTYAHWRRIAYAYSAVGTSIVSSDVHRVSDDEAESTLTANAGAIKVFLSTEPANYDPAHGNGEGMRGFPTLSGWDIQQPIIMLSGEIWGLYMGAVGTAFDPILSLRWRERGTS